MHSERRNGPCTVAAAKTLFGQSPACRTIAVASSSVVRRCSPLWQLGRQVQQADADLVFFLFVAHVANVGCGLGDATFTAGLPSFLSSQYEGGR